MKVKCLCLFFLLVVIQPSWAQEYNSQVKEIMDQVNVDSLVSFVRILSGEDSIQVGGVPALIRHRTNSLDSGNESTAEYLEQKLRKYGLQISDQPYSEDGRNIMAIQSGTDFADQILIICAHYDAVDYYCADDNASGVAAVIEASRILSAYRFKQTIMYAFWDEEEYGLLGSSYFAQKAIQDSLDIRGVINLDMIGWDGNGDGLMEIHTSGVANSPQLADLVFTIDELYDLSLNCEIANPGTQASDHSAFWGVDLGAVLIIEAYYGDDFNPYYHSSEDRIGNFNLAYFTDMSKVAIGTISTLALANPGSITSNHLPRRGGGLAVYPNPLQGIANIQYEISREQKVLMSIYNSIGIKVMDLVDGYKFLGKHTLAFQTDHLTEGIYLLVLKTEDEQISYKLTVVR